MDCRKSLLLASLLMLAAGCKTTFNPFASKQTATNLPGTPPAAATAAEKPSESMLPAAEAFLNKPKEGSKRPPKASTVISLAVMREREASKLEDAAQQMKLHDDARQFYQQALKLEPQSREAHLGLARVYSKMGNFERASEIYAQMLQKEPRDHGTWFELGNCHNRKKDFEPAIQCFLKALELEPENRVYLQTLGFTLARAGMPDDAAIVLAKVMGACHAHYNVARMLDHIGQKQAAKQHLERALQADRHFDPAKHMLAALSNPPSPVTPVVTPVVHTSEASRTPNVLPAFLPPPTPPSVPPPPPVEAPRPSLSLQAID